MAHGAVKHDYHLVNPSPWPFVGSFAAMVMMIGMVIWMKGLFGLDKGTSWVALRVWPASSSPWPAGGST
jgi:cytochrome c oxidase subunit 3